MRVNFRKRGKEPKLSKIFFVDRQGNLVVKQHFMWSLWLMRRAFWELIAFAVVLTAHVFLMGLLVYVSMVWAKSSDSISNWVLFGLLVVLQMVILGFVLAGIVAVIKVFHRKYLAERVRNFINTFEDNFNPPDKS